MAESDNLGLFTTPQQYQQAQAKAMQDQALKYIDLNPNQQAQYGFSLAGQQLGRAIGSALGGEDPELRRITQRQQILGMIDPTNPDSYVQAIQAALQSGDTQTAYVLRNEMMKAKQQAQETQMNEMKYQDYLTQRGLGMQATGLTNLANELVSQLKNPDGTINEEVKAKLLSFPQGRAAISEQAKVLPDLRKLGATGTQEINPFQVFVDDPTVPAYIKATAKQYASSFDKGVYDTEQADKLFDKLSTAAQRSSEYQQTQARLDQNAKQMEEMRQQGLQTSQAYLRLAQQQAEFNQELKRQDLERKAEIEKNKPLRPDLAKEEDADYALAKDAKNLATDAYAYINRIKSGEIPFGLKAKAVIAAKSALGSNDPEVIARNDYDQFLTRLTNETLRLNKGTQTEGDAVRALKEVKSAESPADAARAMTTLSNINLRRVEDAKASVERRRINAGFRQPDVPIDVPKLEPHINSDSDYQAFVKNPKYPSGTVFIDPKGVRRVKP